MFGRRAACCQRRWRRYIKNTSGERTWLEEFLENDYQALPGILLGFYQETGILLGF